MRTNVCVSNRGGGGGDLVNTASGNKAQAY